MDSLNSLHSYKINLTKKTTPQSSHKQKNMKKINVYEYKFSANNSTFKNPKKNYTPNPLTSKYKEKINSSKNIRSNNSKIKSHSPVLFIKNKEKKSLNMSLSSISSYNNKMNNSTFLDKNLNIFNGSNNNNNLKKLNKSVIIRNSNINIRSKTQNSTTSNHKNNLIGNSLNIKNSSKLINNNSQLNKSNNSIKSERIKSNSSSKTNERSISDLSVNKGIKGERNVIKLNINSKGKNSAKNIMKNNNKFNCFKPKNIFYQYKKNNNNHNKNHDITADFKCSYNNIQNLNNISNISNISNNNCQNQNELLKIQEPNKSININNININNINNNISQIEKNGSASTMYTNNYNGKDSKPNNITKEMSTTNNNTNNNNINKIPDNNIEIKNPGPLKKYIRSIHDISKTGLSGDEKKVNQDNYFIFNNFNNNIDYKYIGVCDGHGYYGHEVSQYIIENLPIDLNHILLNKKYDLEKDDLSDAIKKCFIRENEILHKKDKIDSSLSGTTCVSVIYTPTKLIIANIGDSRIVLGKQTSEGKWISEDLSRDHKPTIKEEADRILQKGGRIRPMLDDDGSFIGPLRVYMKEDDIPGLAMTRSFGDYYASIAGTISEPEVTEHIFKEEDKFIVIASDGLFEFIPSSEVVNFVKDYYIQKNIVDCCEFLYKESSFRWIKEEEDTIDDITIIVVFFN